MRGKIGEKWTAIFAACAWALFALSASVASRAATAKALSLEEMNEEIAIKVFDTHLLGGIIDPSTDEPSIWGTFYRGIELSTSISYKTSTGTEGTATIAVVDEDSNSYTFTADNNGSIKPVDGSSYPTLVNESPLDTTADEHEHDFINAASFEQYDSDGDGNYESHLAVCGCGFQLQVAHRLGGSGACLDCGYEFVGSGTANTYTFSGIPDHITNTPEEIDSTGEEIVIEFDDEGVATFDITFTAKLFLGSTLTLSLECSGELTAGDASIPYTIEVSCEDTPSNGTLEIGSPSEGGGNLKRIINTI